MFEPSHLVVGRVSNPFIHNHTSHQPNLASFDNVPPRIVDMIDRFGHEIISDRREAAYDIPLDEGRPLYAMAPGTVLANGSRDRDVSAAVCGGTTFQGEVYIKHSIGSNPTYRESFVVYYSHLRKRLVADGQSVKTGQIIGYVGASGCTGGVGHLHVGVFRLSNINARQTGAPEFGYHNPFATSTTAGDESGNNMGNLTAIDPLGWGAVKGFDPWAYVSWNQSGSGFIGVGAWSIELFKPNRAFPYP
jgi:murein DD-endopeptidase MepM/ murein hydrolase activator NlpD